MAGIRRAVLIAGVLAACNPIEPSGLLLDVERTCGDIGLHVDDPDVLPGFTVHAAAVALHAALRHLPSDRDTVLVLGAGVVGLCMIAALRALGCAARVLVVWLLTTTAPVTMTSACTVVSRTI